MRRLLDLIPGLAHWRAGRRGEAVALGALFAALVALLGWRAETVRATLAHTAELVARTSEAPARLPRHGEHLAAIAAAAAALALLAWHARRTSRAASRSPHDRGEGPWRLVGRRLRANRLAMSGLAVVLLLHLVALLSPLIALHDPEAQGDIVSGRHLPPSLEHPLGTDRLARDVFSRILHGSRVSLLVGTCATGIAVLCGTFYGAVSGFLGGRIDAVLMRVVDVLLAFPSIILLITVVAIWGGQSVLVLALVIGLLSWMGVARLVRGQILSLKEREHVQAARALGAGGARIVFRHLLPGAVTPVIVFATLGVGNAILIEASLSYLGLGVRPPTPSWGNIVYESRGEILTHWWVPLSAGLAVVVTVVGYNLLGDGLRDALDPRRKT